MSFVSMGGGREGGRGSGGGGGGGGIYDVVVMWLAVEMVSLMVLSMIPGRAEGCLCHRWCLLRIPR